MQCAVGGEAHAQRASIKFCGPSRQGEAVLKAALSIDVPLGDGDAMASCAVRDLNTIPCCRDDP